MVTAVDQRLSDEHGELLKPYVPRLLIQWIRDSPGTHYYPVDGTLAFVDISGFTALTETLARQGKIGAELLRDTLDGVLSALLDEAYEWGAGLIKWGGDALLLLFDGPGHPERAARAMWELQLTIDRIGRIRNTGGTTVLRMSIGATTGEVEFFTAGSVHRELFVTGPTATESVQIEAIADAGEIALSPALAALLDPSCIGAKKNGVFLLAGPPDADRRMAPDVGSVAGLDVASCIPLAAREHVLLERSEPEHRIITATFFDLMETDELLARLGPKAFAEALDQRVRAIQEAAVRYEVPFNATDVSKGAIKILLSAGAPSTTGHDEEQTLRLVREVMDQPGVIPLRVGINSGRVFTGDFGPPYRRTYAVLGDAINTAARVMARAEAGQVLATEQVLDRSRTLFQATPIEPFQAKGKAEPVRASLVGPIVGRREKRVVETPFVGRDRELQTLRIVIGDVRDGNGWTVEIAGPSGIGKTRLLRELLAATPDVRVLHSTCEEYEASTPYYALRDPVRDVLELGRDATPAEAEQRLRDVVASAEPELVPWVPLLAIPLGLELPPTPETAAIDERFLREVLADVTLRFLVAALGTSPVALVVEDAQFVDESSADLLRRLAAAARSLPYLFVIARTHPEGLWTDMEDADQRFIVFDLLPLSERQAAEIVEIATDEEPLRPHEIEVLARRSGGSPLFLIELLNVARSSGSTEALPDSIEAVVTADIDRFSASDRIVLRYASVLGVTFDEALLRATLRGEVAFDDGVWGRLEGLVDRDPDGLLRFRNTLVHHTAYEGLPFRRRRELHARVAEAIESAATSLDDEAATLALHYSAARRSDKTWHYGRLGGDRARAVGAIVEAAHLYELALQAGSRVRTVRRRERADVLVSLGKVRETAGLFDESVDAFRRAARLLPDDPVERARIFALRTRPNVRTGAWGRALRETSAGLRLVEGRRGRRAAAVRAMLRAMRAENLMFQGRAHEAIPLATAAAAEAHRAGELEAAARAYTALDGSYQLLGEPQKAVYERLALDIYTRLGDVNARGIVHNNLGVQAYDDGRWSEALEFYERAQDDCLRSGDHQNAAMAATNLGELLVSKGEIDRAERVLNEARRVMRSSRFTPFVLFAEIQLARCALERDDATLALEMLESAIAEARLVGHAGMALVGSTYRAHAHARAGSPELGLVSLDSEAMTARDGAIWRAAAVERARADCLTVLGRTDEARQGLDRALSVAKEQGLLYEEMLIRRDRARLSVSDLDAEDELREAERLAQLLGIVQS
jgi:class 3 adenylate cyclase/tetratricopeptide (TPR) repeat protein